MPRSASSGSPQKHYYNRCAAAPEGLTLVMVEWRMDCGALYAEQEHRSRRRPRVTMRCGLRFNHSWRQVEGRLWTPRDCSTTNRTGMVIELMIIASGNY